MIRKSNCAVTVHRNMKPELYVPLRVQHRLGYNEGVRFLTAWKVGFLIAELRRDPFGREWKRRAAIAGGPLVGRSRLRLKDPSITPAPRFQPIKELQAWIGRVDGKVILELSHPLQVAPKRSVDAYKRAKRRTSPPRTIKRKPSSGLWWL